MGMMILLTVQETAELLKTSRQQVRKMIRNGEIHAVRVGREWRIPETSLERYFSAKWKKNEE